MEFVSHRQRGRGAAARDQPDQALPAALQRAAARRQVVPLHRHPPRHRIAAARQASRRARRRATSTSAPSPRPARSTARSTRCSAPSCCAPAPTACSRPARGPACSTRSSAARRPASAGSTRPSTTRMVDEVRGFLAGRNREVQQALSRAHGQGRGRACEFERAAVCATASARWPHIQAHQAINLPIDRRGRRLRRPCRGRAGLHPGVLLPRRPELRQPRLFPGHAKELDVPEVLARLHRPVLRSARRRRS